ncbi:hypothetical protein MWH28_06280, partial [Natroniella sulfidigena]|uniref:hypothetical protein n=1 Tax=Natroniella sulfidigena TaxID=723921 RepID=UPI002009E15C
FSKTELLLQFLTLSQATFNILSNSFLFVKNFFEIFFVAKLPFFAATSSSISLHSKSVKKNLKPFFLDQHF